MPAAKGSPRDVGLPCRIFGTAAGSRDHAQRWSAVCFIAARSTLLGALQREHRTSSQVNPNRKNPTYTSVGNKLGGWVRGLGASLDGPPHGHANRYPEVRGRHGRVELRGAWIEDGYRGMMKIPVIDNQAIGPLPRFQAGKSAMNDPDVMAT